MKKKRIIICIGVAILLFSGCQINEKVEREGSLNVKPSNKISYEEGYQLVQIEPNLSIDVYEGRKKEYKEWFELGEKLLIDSKMTEIHGEQNAEVYGFDAFYENGDLMGASNHGFVFRTQSYLKLGDFIQLDPGDFYTGDIFSMTEEFSEFSREDAYKRLKSFGDAVECDFSEKYIAYAMDKESMEKALQRFIDNGDDSVLETSVPDEEFYFFYFRNQLNGKDILTKGDTYMGNNSDVQAVVSRNKIEYIAIYDQYSYQKKDTYSIIEPVEAQNVIERKFSDIISDNQIRIYDMDLCYYQNENIREKDRSELIPVYAFTVTTYDGNPSRKVIVDAHSGKEIIAGG